VADVPAALIRSLALEPHPEGGWYRELHRSAATVLPADGRAERSALTCIHFLLAAGEVSRWHRVRSDEVWHFVAGDPLELLETDPPFAATERTVLGGHSTGATAVHVVHAGRWQAARPNGAWTLVSCTVGPGFDFADFTLLRDDPAAAAGMRGLDPGTAALI
jgi:uncharacterized protein